MEDITQELRYSAELKLQVAATQSRVIQVMIDCVWGSMQQGGKLLLCGNGGSAADAQHLATECMVRMQNDRYPLPAVALTTDTSLLTAAGNDYGFDMIFARQVAALGCAGDVLLAFAIEKNWEEIETLFAEGEGAPSREHAERSCHRERTTLTASTACYCPEAPSLQESVSGRSGGARCVRHK